MRVEAEARKQEQAREKDFWEAGGKAAFSPPKEPEDGASTRQSVKEMYQEQFEKAMKFAFEKLNQGIARKRIVRLLNEEGFKTRTGRIWTLSILSGELKRYKER
jgi:hypothetical protein